MALTHDLVWQYVKHLFGDYGGVVVALKWWQDDDPVLRRRLAAKGIMCPGRPVQAVHHAPSLVITRAEEYVDTLNGLMAIRAA
jgi:hypothetical protein